MAQKKKPKKKKAKKGAFIIDVLVEGPGGELIFKPVEVTPDKFDELIKLSKANPIVKYNIEKELKRKKAKKWLKKLKQS